MRRHFGRNSALAVLTLIYLFNFMDRQILAVLAEPIKHDLRLSDTQLGLLNGFFFALFYTTFGVPVAWLADRSKRTWVIGTACLFWSGFCAAGAFAINFATLAAARMGVATGEAGGVAPSYSLIAAMYPAGRRARAIAIYSMGVPLGLGAGTAAGGWIAATFGWRVAFIAVASPGIVLALVLLLFVEDSGRSRLDAGRAKSASCTLGEAVSLFFCSRPLLLVSLSSSLGAFVCYGLMAWIAAYLQRVLGMTLKQEGSWLSLTLAVGLAGGIWTSGFLADRFVLRDPRFSAWIPAAAMILGAPLLVGATVINDWRLALPCFGLAIGLSVFYLAPSVSALSQLVDPDHRSTASALLLLILNLVGLGGGPLAIGTVSDLALQAWGQQSLRVAFWALSPVFWLAAGASLFAARSLRFQSGADKEPWKLAD